ncbi:MAG: helix-turn-helix transcriptional regulator, partial [Propionibacteriaceae bacterium]|nr:helix-turn-helix transcriptional regulator [Propionibacteriaceae bacterium]
DVTLDQLAAVFSYSPTHLSRLLQGQTGRRFADLKRGLKVHHAMEFLVNTSLTLDEISAAVGFSSASYLAQVFRAQVGMTPGQVRAARTDGGRDPGPD